MSSPSYAPQPARRRSTANLNSSTTYSKPTANEDDGGLTQSLSQLSLTHEPAPRSPVLSKTATPLKPPSRRSSRSPVRRQPSRSPSTTRDSRARSPTLLRKASTNSLRSVNGVAHPPAPPRRASSAQIMSPTSKAAFFGTSPQEEEKPILTASSIARSQLQSELDLHHGPGSKVHPKAVVIINDAVYGHRFSRPRTSRGALSTIVERPERIKASVLGVSSAYVRLGERHSEGSQPLHPRRDVHGLRTIPFRIHKTERTLSLLSQAVTNVHGTKWMEELKMMCDAAESKLAMGGKELQRPDIVRGRDSPVPAKLHEGDLYLCEESLNAMEGALGAVCEAVDTVFGAGPRRAFVGVRPPGHHCSASHPSGFCWVNNVHVGIMHAALNHGLTHAAIIDFDLHHGDGSQDITWKHNARAISSPKNAPAWKKTSIGYFSIHDINSYPCEMGDDEKVKNASVCIDNAHGQNIWNVHLHSWKSEQEFWELYETKYCVLLEKTRKYLRTQAERLRAANLPPRAAIFFSAGFDASEWESAGMQRHQVNVPTEFYARLTQDVVKLASEEGLYTNGRVISVLEGGYSDRALCSGVFSHLSGLVGEEGSVPQSPQIKQEPSGLGYEMGQKMGVIPDEDAVMDEEDMSSVSRGYDPLWWSSLELDKLENVAQKTVVPVKKARKSIPTYNSPTQASTAKVSDPINMRRSLSGLSTGAKPSMRSVSPPPPEVNWFTAAYELSQLLIPDHRQTDSCTAEDLNAEASRVRRERQAAILGLPASSSVPPSPAPERSSSRMALRERRGKPSTVLEEGYERTIGIDTPSKRSTSATRNGRRSSRRLSGASTATTPRSITPPPPLPTAIQSVDRPLTSKARRPDAAMNVRTQSADKLPIKKTRTPAPARKSTTATPSATPKATPRAPRGTKKTTATPARRTNAAAATASTTGAGNQQNGSNIATPDATASDVDRLSSGLKKIKINLITQSQKVAREKARLDTDSSNAPSPGTSVSNGDQTVDSPQGPPLPYADSINVVSPSDLAPSDTLSVSMASSSSRAVTPVQDTYSSSSLVTPEPKELASSALAPPPPPETPQVAVYPSSDADPGFFIPYQPEGPEPEPVSRQEPLTWLPPNVPTPSAQTPAIGAGARAGASAAAATPSPMKKQNNLFHYTSGIPFAPRPQNSGPKSDLLDAKNALDENKARGVSPSTMD